MRNKYTLTLIIGAIGSVLVSIVMSLGLNIYFNQSIKIFGWTNWIYISNLISFSIAMYIYGLLMNKRVLTDYKTWTISFIFAFIVTLFTVSFGKIISMYILEGHSFVVTLAGILDSFIISVLVFYLPFTLGCYLLFRVYNKVSGIQKAI